MVKYTIRSIVCEASCHQVTLSLGHLVTWSLGHSVTRSLGTCVQSVHVYSRLVLFILYHSLLEYIRQPSGIRSIEMKPQPCQVSPVVVYGDVSGSRFHFRYRDIVDNLFSSQFQLSCSSFQFRCYEVRDVRYQTIAANDSLQADFSPDVYNNVQQMYTLPSEWTLAGRALPPRPTTRLPPPSPRTTGSPGRCSISSSRGLYSISNPRLYMYTVASYCLYYTIYYWNISDNRCISLRPHTYVLYGSSQFWTLFFSNLSKMAHFW